ncbi:MAG: ExbD/TolR family protein [Phormidesmis sp.]
MKVDMNNRQSDVQIEILPMIDVIFCILTFFILAAVGLTRQQVIDLTLPAVNNSVPVSGESRDRLYISVDSVGQVYIDSNAVPLSLLQDVLVQHQQIAPNGTIVLYASSSARYEDVIKVLDLLRSVGGDRVALATLPNGASLDPTQSNDIGQFGQPGGTLTQPLPGTTGTPGGMPDSGFPASPGSPGSPGSGAIPGGGLPPVSPGAAPSPTGPTGAPPVSGDAANP